MRLPAPRGARGHEQRGARFGVIVQADELIALPTVIVAPTSLSAPPRLFRPEVVLAGETTRVLVEQLRTVDARLLGPVVGLGAGRDSGEWRRGRSGPPAARASWSGRRSG